MRKLLSRAIAAVAARIYDLGCSLYCLSDRLDGWDGEVAEEPPRQTSTTYNGTNAAVTVTWTSSGFPQP